MSTKEKHLYYLSELKDYKVNSKDSDIRGWEVKDLDNRRIGKVDNLLVNKELAKVMYVDVEVDQSIIDINHDPYAHSGYTEFSEFINKEGENHIIIPIGLIDLNLDNKHVITEDINYETFAETKRYQSGTTISRDYENHVLGSYERRSKHFNREDEIKRTRTAYKAENTVDRDLLEREDSRIETEAKTPENRSSNELQERIRREKENLRKSSGGSKPVDDHNRALHQNDKPGDLQPERTLDEDSNWQRGNRDFLDDDNYPNEKRKTRKSEDFYDRREFFKKG